MFLDILEEVRVLVFVSEEGRIVMYILMGVDWVFFGYSRRKRLIELVVLDKGVFEKMFNDIKEFIENFKWYYDRGISYRRGYFLYGLFGCGKSSYIIVLVGKISVKKFFSLFLYVFLK